MTSELDEVHLVLEDDDFEIGNWTSYSYHSDFLTPTDGWTFTIGDDRVKDLARKFETGRNVRLVIDGHTQADGLIDSVDVQSSRSGTFLTISGRDRLAQAIDSTVDPRTRFKADMTLLDVMKAAFGPYGWTSDDQYLVSNEVNRNVITGQRQGIPYTKGGKKKAPKPLKSFTIHQLKPYPSEGVYEFCERIAKRFGLHIWLSAQGNLLVVGKPDFDQKASYEIRNLVGDAGRANNVIQGRVTRESSEQPSVIVATGRGGGGDFERSSLMVIMVNELLGLDENRVPFPEVQSIIDRYPAATKLEYRSSFKPAHRQPSRIARPMFLHDEESATLEQLEFFVRRKMAHHQHLGFKASYTFEGHKLDDVPWCVDTIANVDDDFADVHEPLWIKSRHFSKSRDQGTRTTVDLILPHTLDFGE